MCDRYKQLPSKKIYHFFDMYSHVLCTCPGINILTTHENWNLLACFIFMTRGVYFIVLRYHVSPSCANYRNDSDVVAVRLLLEWKKKKEEKKNRKRVTAKNRISEKLRKKKEKLLYDVSLCIVSSIVMLNSW